MLKREKVQSQDGKLRGYWVNDSSNVKFIGWVDGDMLVWFKSGVYKYLEVSRQRCVAAALAPSAGRYIAFKIKLSYKAVRIA